MMKRETFAIANIYVPVKRRATLDPKKAQEIAESILQVGLQGPIRPASAGADQVRACNQPQDRQGAWHPFRRRCSRAPTR
jgi:hypothetical protein